MSKLYKIRRPLGGNKKRRKAASAERRRNQICSWSGHKN